MLHCAVPCCTVLYHVAHLLDADGVLCELAAPVADQVGAVPSVDQLCLSLKSLHGPSKPTVQEALTVTELHIHTQVARTV